MKKGLISRLFFVLRVVLLLCLLAAAWILYDWSRDLDPRFFAFLNTRPGRVLSAAFRWDKLQGFQRAPEKPLEAWSDRERAVKDEIERTLLERAPPYKLVLRDGKELYGFIHALTPETVSFSESYGDSGVLQVKLRRRRIRSIIKLNRPRPRVTYRDVRYRMSFPAMNFYKRPPYTIMTDESFFQVEHAVRTLQQLHQEFLKRFGDWIDSDRQSDNIQVLFFSDEDSFRAYQKKYAPMIENGTGFYSPSLDRLVVYNQTRSAHMRELSRNLDRREAAYQARSQRYGGLARINAWRKNTQRNLMSRAEQETATTIRHEGAHQLFYTYGIHSNWHAENDWLIEGLATYCETRPIGSVTMDQLDILKFEARKGRLIPLDKLVAARGPHGLFVFGDSRRVNLAYRESWALVQLLMQPEYRSAFGRYIRFVRDPANSRALRKIPRLKLLASTLGLSPWELQQRWEESIRRL